MLAIEAKSGLSLVKSIYTTFNCRKNLVCKSCKKLHFQIEKLPHSARHRVGLCVLFIQITISSFNNKHRFFNYCIVGKKDAQDYYYWKLCLGICIDCLKSKPMFLLCFLKILSSEAHFDEYGLDNSKGPSWIYTFSCRLGLYTSLYLSIRYFLFFFVL